METVCKYCKYFVQHYVKAGGEYVNAYCGHCNYGDVKHVTPEDSCSSFLTKKGTIEPKKTK